MTAILLGLLAGSLTTLSPCVLPVLPFVLFAALDKHRYGPLALAAGMAATFTVVGTLISGAGLGLDVSGDAVRYTAAAFMAVFGIVLLSTVLQQRFALAGAPLVNRLNGVADRLGSGGVGGQFALGAVLGAVWTPCSGPTLGAAVTLAASKDTVGQAGLVMLVFSLGAALPMLAIAYGSRATLAKRKAAFQRIGQAAKPVLGAIILGAALLVFTGYDKRLEAMLLDLTPDWLTTLTTRF